MKKHSFFIFILLITPFLSIKTSFALEKLIYTCPSTIIKLCDSKTNNTSKDISKDYFGLSHEIVKKITDQTSVQFDFLESKTISDTIKKTSFKGKSSLKNNYPDIAIGIPFSPQNKNLEYIFNPILTEKIVLIKNNAFDVINENILLNELKTSQIYITDEINLENISSKIKESNGYFHHTNITNEIFDIKKIKTKEELLSIASNSNAKIITTSNNLNLIKEKFPDKERSKIKIRNNYANITYFLAINKMSILKKNRNKNIVSKIKLITEEINK